jgi:hypothetical protein
MSETVAAHLDPPADRPGSLLSRLPALLEAPLWFVRAARKRRADQLEREFRAARLALAAQMYRAGIDDGETGPLIAATDQQLLAARYAGSSREALEAEREKLLVRLADAALEDDSPLPGADDEFARAWALKVARGV